MPNRKTTPPTWLTRQTVIVTAVLLGGVGLVIILALLLSSAMAKVHRQDAFSGVSKVVASYNTMLEKEVPYTAATKNTTTSDADFTALAQSYQTAYTSYVAEVDRLKSAWTLSEAPLRAAYDAFIAKHNVFVDANGDRQAVMTALRQVTAHCREQTLGAMDTSDLAKLVEAFDKTFSPCTSAITALKNSKNSVVSEVGKQSMSYFDDLRKRAEAMQSTYQAGDRAKFEAEYNEFLKLAESLSTYTDMSKIYTHYRDILPGKELTELANLMSEEVV